MKVYFAKEIVGCVLQLTIDGINVLENHNFFHVQNVAECCCNAVGVGSGTCNGITSNLNDYNHALCSYSSKILHFNDFNCSIKVGGTPLSLWYCLI